MAEAARGTAPSDTPIFDRSMKVGVRAGITAALVAPCAGAVCVPTLYDWAGAGPTDFMFIFVFIRGILYMPLVAMGVFVIVAPATAAILRLTGRRSSVSACRRCGYDLRGSSGPACPDCGEAIDTGLSA